MVTKRFDIVLASFRFVFIIFLLSLSLILGVVASPPVSADEFDDAKVAFGAFEDGLYDFSRQELENFLLHYPESEMVEQIRLVLVLCCLETGFCQRADALYTELRNPDDVTGFGVDPAALELRIGNCFLGAGDEDRARKIFSKLIKEYPQSDAALTARFELADRFFYEKNFAAANQMVTPLLIALQAKKKRLLKINRQKVYWIAALSRYQLKKFKSCLSLLQTVVDDSEKFPLVNRERQDLYTVMIECAWHCQNTKVLKEILQKWVQIPELELDHGKLSAAAQLAAEILRGQSRMAEIRVELIKIVRLAISKEDKVPLYGLLIEIDRENEKALKAWIKASIALHAAGSPSRINLLRSLLLLNHKVKDYAGSVAVGGILSAEDKDFWKNEGFYFPYLCSLEKVGKCSEIVNYVPALLPPYEKAVTPGERRYALDIGAGNCLQKLERFNDAVVFYRSMYAHYSDSLIRVKLLATLHSLAAKIVTGEHLDDWISAEVIASFSLDRRENEKLLRGFPELVLLVADHFFQAQAYAKAQPSLLWLENLELTGEIADRVTFLLAEAYYRCEDLGEALIRYQALYDGDSKGFRYLSALRLVAIYEAQGYRSKQIKLYKDLLSWEKDPHIKAELQQKLKVLVK